MNQKKIGVILGFLFLIIFLLGFVSAQSCSIVARGSCSDYVVMGLSSQTNAHGELSSEGNYNYVLCCDFGSGNTSCNGANKIIGLSDMTNAHAEIPTLNTYSYSVCYENLNCTSNTGSCQAGYDMQMLSLSANTNAHIGQFGDYSIKICCKAEGIPPPGIKEAHWANINNPDLIIYSILVVPEETQVLIVLKNAELPQGTDVIFEIYEDDLIIDDEIRTGSDSIIGSVNDQGNAISYWTITENDLSKTFDLDNFYFITNGGETSGDLSITISDETCIGINYCSDYTDQIMCEEDTCDKNITKDSVENNEPEITCGEEYVCECVWDGTTCGPKWTAIGENITIDPSVPELGTCLFSEDTDDDCTDGLLTYSWVANIDWPADNSGWSSEQDCIDAGGDALGCVFFDSLIEQNFDNKWHYDPKVEGVNPLLNYCHWGSNTISCPAQTQLQFFGFYNVIVTLAVITLIYTLIILRKEFK